MTRFKNPIQQETFDKFRAMAILGTVPDRLGGGVAEAYWHGRNGIVKKYLKTSIAYAAFAAGREDAIAADKDRVFREARAERTRKIVELYVAHDVATANIAARLGIGERTVLEVLQQNGVEVDGGQMRNWA